MIFALALAAGCLGADAPTPIAVERGRACVDLRTPRPASRTLVIVSALARDAGPFPIRLAATSTTPDALRPPAFAADPPGTSAVSSMPPRRSTPPAVRTPPPPSRRFCLLVRDGDAASASNYRAIDARLAAFGERVQVYVDPDDASTIDPGLVPEVVATFDRAVYPFADRRFGAAEDVDGDGRFTVFVSGWLARLGGGRYRVDGFVRGADFDRSVGEPFGNRADMMYLAASLGPGPHLKTVLAHEYTHAVLVGRKAFPDGPDGPARPEEEGWLDEGLAHVVEDAHGFSRSNLDYRVSAFLSRPEAYRLVVEDYDAAGLFRGHGNRGATYLFLRWCVDRHGEAALDRLVASSLRGTANVEAATGRPFAALFREWTVALFLSGLDPSEPGGYLSLDPRGTFGDRLLAGPRPVRVQPDGPGHEWSAAGTSAHFVVVDGSARGGVRVDVDGPERAGLQVTAVPLPDGLGALDLEVRPVADSSGAVEVRARVASRGDAPLRLGAIAWEPQTPPADPRDGGPGRGGLDPLGIARRFGTSSLPPNGRLASGPIRLDGLTPGDGPIVVKAVGTDPAGRRVAAWAEVLRPSGALADGP